MKYGRTAKRIQTMWSPEYGWCRWDPHLEDYIPDPRLNKKPFLKAVDQNGSDKEEGQKRRLLSQGKGKIHS